MPQKVNKTENHRSDCSHIVFCPQSHDGDFFCLILYVIFNICKQTLKKTLHNPFHVISLNLE